MAQVLPVAYLPKNLDEYWESSEEKKTEEKKTEEKLVGKSLLMNEDNLITSFKQNTLNPNSLTSLAKLSLLADLISISYNAQWVLCSSKSTVIILEMDQNLQKDEKKSYTIISKFHIPSSDAISCLTLLPLYIPYSQKQIKQYGALSVQMLIAIGFESGYFRIYTEAGVLMLSQLLHPKILKKIQIRYSQWLPHNTPPMGTVAMNDHIDSDVDEVVLVFERNKAVVIDGNSLWTSLRLLNNIISIPSEQRSEADHESLRQASTFAYKKWSFDHPEVLDISACGPSFVPCNLFSLASIPYSASAPLAPILATSSFIVAGLHPFLSFYATWERSQSLSSAATLANMVASKMTNAVFSFAKSLWGSHGNNTAISKGINVISGGSLVSPSSASPIGSPQNDHFAAVTQEEDQRQKNQSLASSTCLDALFSLYDPHRRPLILSVCPLPNIHLTALTDSLGRVVLIDTQEGEVIRIFKGFRAAQIGWIQIECQNYNQNNSIKQHNLSSISKSSLIFLCIYSGKRGILEIWHLRYGTRIFAADVGTGSKLFTTVCAGLGGGIDSAWKSTNHLNNANAIEEHYSCQTWLLDSGGEIHQIILNTEQIFNIETKNHKKIEPVHEKHTILLQKIDELSFTESLSFEEWKIKKDQTLKDFFEISLQIASSSYKDLFQTLYLMALKLSAESSRYIIKTLIADSLTDIPNFTSFQQILVYHSQIATADLSLNSTDTKIDSTEMRKQSFQQYYGYLIALLNHKLMIFDEIAKIHLKFNESKPPTTKKSNDLSLSEIQNCLPSELHNIISTNKMATKNDLTVAQFLYALGIIAPSLKPISIFQLKKRLPLHLIQSFAKFFLSPMLNGDLDTFEWKNRIYDLFNFPLNTLKQIILSIISILTDVNVPFWSCIASICQVLKLRPLDLILEIRKIMAIKKKLLDCPFQSDTFNSIHIIGLYLLDLNFKSKVYQDERKQATLNKDVALGQSYFDKACRLQYLNTNTRSKIFITLQELDQSEIKCVERLLALKKDILDHQSNTKPTWIKKYNANLINCYHLNECAKSLVICLSKCDDTFSGEEAVSIETLNQDLTAVNQEEDCMELFNQSMSQIENTSLMCILSLHLWKNYLGGIFERIFIGIERIRRAPRGQKCLKLVGMSEINARNIIISCIQVLLHIKTLSSNHSVVIQEVEKFGKFFGVHQKTSTSISKIYNDLGGDIINMIRTYHLGSNRLELNTESIDNFRILSEILKATFDVNVQDIRPRKLFKSGVEFNYDLKTFKNETKVDNYNKKDNQNDDLIDQKQSDMALMETDRQYQERFAFIIKYLTTSKPAKIDEAINLARYLEIDPDSIQLNYAIILYEDDKDDQAELVKVENTVKLADALIPVLRRRMASMLKKYKDCPLAQRVYQQEDSTSLTMLTSSPGTRALTPPLLRKETTSQKAIISSSSSSSSLSPLSSSTKLSNSKISDEDVKEIVLRMKQLLDRICQNLNGTISKQNDSTAFQSLHPQDKQQKVLTILENALNKMLE